jgi:hypothetical protein
VVPGAPLVQPRGAPAQPSPYASSSPYARSHGGADIGENAGVRMLLPVGRSMWAIAAGYLGLFSVLFVPAPLALICGIMAIIDIKKHPDRHGMGRAIFGIVMSVLAPLAVIALILATNRPGHGHW